MGRMSELDALIREMRNIASDINDMADSLSEAVSIGDAKPTLEDVRSALSEKSRQGYTTEVKQLLKSHNADRLSQLQEKDYEEVLQEVKTIGE